MESPTHTHTHTHTHIYNTRAHAQNKTSETYNKNSQMIEYLKKANLTLVALEQIWIPINIMRPGVGRG